MHVLVTKTPDPPYHLTRAGHGTIYDDNLTPEKVVDLGDDHALKVFRDKRYDRDVVWFTWTDFFDAATPGVAHKTGIRHAIEVAVPGVGDTNCGYAVVVSA